MNIYLYVTEYVKRDLHVDTKLVDVLYKMVEN